MVSVRRTPVRTNDAAGGHPDVEVHNVWGGTVTAGRGDCDHPAQNVCGRAPGEEVAVREDDNKTLGVLDPVGGGDPIPLCKERLLVGRRPDCDICLPFANVSAKHCELVLVQGYWTVRDLNSTNGTKVNGQRVHEKRVYPGDIIGIASHRYRIEYTPDPVQAHDADTDSLFHQITHQSLLERANLVRSEERRARRRRIKLPETPVQRRADGDFDYGPDETPPFPGSGSPASTEELLRFVEEEERQRSTKRSEE